MDDETQKFRVLGDETICSVLHWCLVVWEEVSYNAGKSHTHTHAHIYCSPIVCDVYSTLPCPDPMPHRMISTSCQVVPIIKNTFLIYSHGVNKGYLTTQSLSHPHCLRC